MAFMDRMAFGDILGLGLLAIVAVLLLIILLHPLLRPRR